MQPFALYQGDLAVGSLGAVTGGAIFINGIDVQTSLIVPGMSVRMGTATGNIDLGIYDEQFNLLAHSGPTAAIASSVNALNFPSPLYLTKGRYWLAFIDTVGTDTAWVNSSQLGGMLVSQRSVGTAFTQLVQNTSWQSTVAKMALVARVQGGYP